MRTRAERALLVVVLATVLVATGCGSDSSESSAVSGGSSAPDAAVWPFADSATRYGDARSAAEGFAADYLGFVDPVIGSFVAGDDRSGEVGVRPSRSGPVTTVAVRHLTSDDTWWVVAAATPALQLDVPAANSSITAPVALSGRSTAFEGTVRVEIRQDGTLAPVGTDFVTGGANGEMGPFSKAISFDPPSAANGAIVLRTLGGESGTTGEASVVRVHFGRTSHASGTSAQ